MSRNLSTDKPPIQKGWREYCKLWEEEQNLLSFPERTIKMLEMLVQVIPYLYATYFYAAISPARTSRKHFNRKHRNL